MSNNSLEIAADLDSLGSGEKSKKKSSARKNTGKIVKILFGIILFAGVLFWKNNYQKLIEIFSTFNITFFLLAILISLLLNLLSSFKWKLFVNEFEKIPIKRLFSIYIIGKYFSNFLPSMVGGDISRIYILGKQLNSHTKAAASILLERITGLVALILLAGIFALLNLRILNNEVIRYSLSAMILLGILFILLLFSPEFFKIIERWMLRFKIFKKVIIHLNHFTDNIIYLREKPNLLFKTMLLSFLFHLTTSVLIYAACLSINFEPNFIRIFLISPIIFLIASLPVSPNNIGWWEWIFAIILIYAGAASAQGLAVALTIRAVVIMISLPGAFLVAKENFELRK